MNFLARFLKNESGDVLLQYAFLLLVVVLVIFTAIRLVGVEVVEDFQNTADAFPSQ